MSTQHFFFSRINETAPERWSEAFPAGLVLDAAGLALKQAILPVEQYLVWLSSSDEQWADCLRAILQSQPATRVLLLSGVPDSLEGVNALNQGVRGYTHAYAVPALLQEVALVVEHGGLWVGPDLLQRLVGSTSAALTNRAVPVVVPAPVSPVVDGWSTLSMREAQVARAVLAGRSNKEVADVMFISERTVKAHLGAVFEKLGVRDRLQLVLRLATMGDRNASPVQETLP